MCNKEAIWVEGVRREVVRAPLWDLEPTALRPVKVLMFHSPPTLPQMVVVVVF